MKISKNLPQFENKKAILSVIGKQEGKFYLAENGQILKVGEFVFSKPAFRDREGFFAHSGRIGVFETGATQEPPKEEILESLKKNFKKNVEKIFIDSNPDSIYIFSFPYFANFFKNNTGNKILKKVKFILVGDYFHHHPFDLLEALKEKIVKKPVLPIKEEALDIIKKSEKARKVIKGK